MMIKRFFSLKRSLAAAVLALTVVLVLGFTELSAEYFRRGMHTIMAENLEKAANIYMESYSPEQRQGRDIVGYWVSANWADQPGRVRARFDPAELVVDRVSVKDPMHDHGDPDDALYFVMTRVVQGQPLFISHWVTRESGSLIVRDSLHLNFDLLTRISVSTIAAIAVFMWLVYWLVNKPIAALWQWTQSLTPKTLSQPVPDFTFPDLNRLAHTIHGSLNDVQDALDREHRFLRHASHELRTPIAVVRNNIELLRKIQEKDSGQGQSERALSSLNRIDRASLTMKNLTETLLWLSRDDGATVPEHDVDLAVMLAELVDENRYLLESKDVVVEFTSEPYRLSLAEVPARIILSNLIRNAFQHTWKGRVEIRQQGGTIFINNVNDEEQTPSDSELGFGLGLQLADKLSQKLSWRYLNKSQAFGHEVTLKVD